MSTCVCVVVIVFAHDVVCHCVVRFRVAFSPCLLPLLSCFDVSCCLRVSVCSGCRV